MIEVKEMPIEEAIKVNKKISEFNDNIDMGKEYFENRYKGREKLIIVAYYNEVPAGYIVGYDMEEDSSFYCWMAGVDNEYRRLGILTRLMDYQINWIKDRGYKTLKIKTRNNRREMLSFLIKKDFYFTEVENMDDIKENRIYLQKDII